MKPRTYTLISSRSVVTISVLVVCLTIAGVFLWGLGRHSTFFENSILSTTLLSAVFFVFITVNLYRGVKLKDDLGRISAGKVPFDSSLDLTTADHTHSGPAVEVGEGLEGILISILLWILWGVLVAITLWFFANLFVVIIATFAAMLYWIFFRAMRLVFKNSSRTKENVWASVKYGLLYTFLYNSWIYGIFILVAYLKH